MQPLGTLIPLILALPLVGGFSVPLAFTPRTTLNERTFISALHESNGRENAEIVSNDQGGSSDEKDDMFYATSQSSLGVSMQEEGKEKEEQAVTEEVTEAKLDPAEQPQGVLPPQEVNPVVEEFTQIAQDLGKRILEQVVIPMFQEPIEKNVPKDVVTSAALTSASLTVLAGKGLAVGGAAAAGAAWLSIAPGQAGNITRSFGKLALESATVAGEMYKKVDTELVIDVAASIIGNVAGWLAEEMKEVLKREPDMTLLFETGSVQGEESDDQTVMGVDATAVESAPVEEAIMLEEESSDEDEFFEGEEGRAGDDMLDEEDSEEFQELEVLEDEDEWEASVRLAKQLDGQLADELTTVSVDEETKAKWDAAGERAKDLVGDKEFTPPDPKISQKAIEDAARMLEEELAEAERERQQQRQQWREGIVMEDEDVDDLNVDLAEAARAAVDMMQAQDDETDDTDDEADIFDEDFEDEDMADLAEAARAAVDMMQAQDDEADDTDDEADIFDDDFEDGDMADLAEAARAAVDMMQAQDDETDDTDDETDLFDEDFEDGDMADLAEAARAAVEMMSSSDDEEEEDEEYAEIDRSVVEDENDDIFADSFDETDIADLEEAVRTGIQISGDGNDNMESWMEDFDEGLDLDGLGRAARAAVEEMRQVSHIDGGADLASDATGVNGFINGESVAQDWSQLKVAELKEELMRRGLKATGKKADLVARLEATGDVESDPDAAGPLYESMTVASLKTELRSRGLPATGKKADLIDRLVGSDEGEGEEMDGKDEQVFEEEEPKIYVETTRDEIVPDYDSMTVPELKECLRGKGMKVGGKKAELIERLKSS